MKKLLLITGLFLILIATSLVANAAEITSINVEVHLNNDGSAYVTEIWETARVYEGTQISRVMNLSQDRTIHSLAVSDIHGTQFIITDDWNKRTDFESRANHASVLTTSDGYEIIWGITDHGNNRYVVSYILEGLVQGYFDGNGFGHQFVSFGLEPAPNQVSLRMTADFDITDENVLVDFYGMSGNFEIDDVGAMVVYSVDDFSSDNALVFMALFDLDLFEPTVRHEAYFEPEAHVGDTNGSFLGLLIVLGVVVVASIIVLILYGHFYSRTKLSDGTVKKWPKINEIPDKYNSTDWPSLPVVYYLLSQKSPLHTKTCSSAFSGYLLKWIKEDVITIEKVKKRSLITLNECLSPLPALEQTLYDLLASYMNQNRQLSSGATKMWEKLMPEIHKWEKRVYGVGEKELKALMVLAPDGTFTRNGYDVLVEFWGFVKFLKLQHKADKLEYAFNHEHLIIASMAGLKKEMRSYYQNHVTVNDDMFNIWMLLWLTQSFDSQVQTHYQNSEAVSGGGGFDGGSVSSGGGGGGIS